MPWSTPSVSELRTALVHAVRTAQRPLAYVCRDFGVSRATAYKWLARFDAQPDAPLTDRSRRPHTSPTRTATALENAVLQVRDQFGWGPRKIVAYLRNHERPTPPVRTAAAILARHHRVRTAAAEPPALQRFERPKPNQLWQLDFKGYLWVARQKIHPLTVLDDHSRYLLLAQPCTNLTMATAWKCLWNLFGEVGLPAALLCDNAFGTHNPGVPTLSWFEAQIVRLGVRPIHGRPYHPQTQGKVERIHGTFVRELWPTIRRDCLDHFAADLTRWRIEVYNPIRPHEALGDQPPVSRWRPSSRPRPERLPTIEYPSGAIVRKVASTGDISWHCARILVGQGLAGEWVRVAPTDSEIVVWYAAHEIRRIPLDNLRLGGML